MEQMNIKKRNGASGTRKSLKKKWMCDRFWCVPGGKFDVPPPP